jgi:hypothetical protein
MESKDIRLIRSVLTIVRESEGLIRHFQISVISVSSKTFDGTSSFLKRIKITLLVQMIIAILGVSDTTIEVLRNLWLRITKMFYKV